MKCPRDTLPWAVGIKMAIKTKNKDNLKYERLNNIIMFAANNEEDDIGHQ